MSVVQNKSPRRYRPWIEDDMRGSCDRCQEETTRSYTMCYLSELMASCNTESFQLTVSPEFRQLLHWRVSLIATPRERWLQILRLNKFANGRQPLSRALCRCVWHRRQGSRALVHRWSPINLRVALPLAKNDLSSGEQRQDQGCPELHGRVPYKI